jgi:uncharacterized Zn finger protein
MHLTDSLLSSLIEERYRKRGREYFTQGMVDLTSVTPSKVTAKCAGTRLYKTRLELKNAALSGECSCPAFTDFGPCKHMAAVGYAVMAKHKTGYAPSEAYAYRKEECSRLEKHLTRKTKAELVMLIMQLMQEDTDLLWMIEEEMEE